MRHSPDVTHHASCVCFMDALTFSPERARANFIKEIRLLLFSRYGTRVRTKRDQEDRDCDETVHNTRSPG